MPSKLEWSKVNLTITTKQQEEKIILNDLAGRVYGGQLLAIMGPTGKSRVVQLFLSFSYHIS